MINTIPIKKYGNWERLKAINPERIITEIVMTAKFEISDPTLEIKSDNYMIDNKIVSLKVGNDIIFQTKGILLEIEFDPNKIPYKEVPELRIPKLVIKWFNEILRQNNFHEVNFIKNTTWTKIFVNYKLRNKIIAQIIYPKVIDLGDRYRYVYGNNRDIEISK